MTKSGIVAKITAAPVGGELGERKKERLEMHVEGKEGKKVGKAFGLPSIRWGKRCVAKKLGDATVSTGFPRMHMRFFTSLTHPSNLQIPLQNYGDDSTAKALISPPPRNVYGIHQLAEFERHLRNLDWKTVPKPPPTATTFASNPNPYPYSKTPRATQSSLVAV